MATATGTVRHPKGGTEPDPDPSLSARGFLSAFLDSSIGAKLTVGLTGALLVLFTVGHLVGNLKVFQGPDAINAYAYFLKHDIGLLLWAARGGLLVVFVLHLVLALRLQFRAKAARPVAYAHPRSVQAGVSSRTMLYTGILVLLYVLLHVAHFTLGWVKPAHVLDPATGQTIAVNYLDLHDAKGRHDVYGMVVAGFTNPVIAVIYVVAQLVLFLHLRHGIPSTFQTLGIKSTAGPGPWTCSGCWWRWASSWATVPSCWRSGAGTSRR